MKWCYDLHAKYLAAMVRSYGCHGTSFVFNENIHELVRVCAPVANHLARLRMFTFMATLSLKMIHATRGDALAGNNPHIVRYV